MTCCSSVYTSSKIKMFLLSIHFMCISLQATGLMQKIRDCLDWVWNTTDGHLFLSVSWFIYSTDVKMLLDIRVCVCIYIFMSLSYTSTLQALIYLYFAVCCIFHSHVPKGGLDCLFLGFGENVPQLGLVFVIFRCLLENNLCRALWKFNNLIAL